MEWLGGCEGAGTRMRAREWGTRVNGVRERERERERKGDTLDTLGGRKQRRCREKRDGRDGRDEDLPPGRERDDDENEGKKIARE